MRSFTRPPGGREEQMFTLLRPISPCSLPSKFQSGVHPRPSDTCSATRWPGASSHLALLFFLVLAFEFKQVIHSRSSREHFGSHGSPSQIHWLRVATLYRLFKVH